MFKFPHTDGVRVHVRLKVKPDFLNLNLNLTGGGACQKWQLGVFAHGCYLVIALESRAG